ncbi:MAG: mechanosensitive ion channel family protein [Candidatus Omnitrophica bacterium]|nr:mechanosensitive ion channel family protein [Candidatus Omnitrophota bacterium]MBU1925671.1 mechanosensitive ion channel family protein [Candidatus Omnitrophota bacterium]
MKDVVKKVSWVVVKKTFVSFFLLLFFCAGYIFYKIRIALAIPLEVRHELRKYIGTIFIILITLIIHKIAGAIIGWYRENIAAKTATTLDNELLPIIRRTLNVIIWITAFLVVLPLYGVNINALIATLGVGSLAIALAAQDTIANIIAGFLIMIDRPFRVGDKIKLPTGETAEVLSIGVRRSRFIGEDKAVIIVPNVDLSKNKIVNYTYGKEMENEIFLK